MKLSATFASVLLLLAGQATAAECEIENWRYFKLGENIQIEGRATCANGRIHLSAYSKEGEYLGNGWTFVREHNFTVYVQNAETPSEMEIRYEITTK